MSDQRSLWARLLHPRCPFCGKGRLYRNLLAIAPACAECGADFSANDAADGPAFFAMTVAGGLLSALVLVMEMRYHPPYWVYWAVFLPLGAALLLASLRVSKTALVLAKFRLVD